jgi:putative ABC transport system permease protein
MRAVLTQIRAAVLRRRAQTATVLLISLLAGSLSTMALTLLVRSSQPWDDAFARLSGPHLVFHLDASRVTVQQLEATESQPGVTAAGPPRQAAVLPFQSGADKGPVMVVERADTGGALDRLVIAAGRWPERPGEIATARSNGFGSPLKPRLGDTMQAVTSGQLRSFAVVGEVVDVTAQSYSNNYSTRRAFVLPGEVTALVDGDQVRLGYEMAYRFQRAATQAELAADRRQVEAALPPGASVLPVIDWLAMRSGSTWLISFLSSLIFAFAVFALLAAALIVASVVGGVVLVSFREIGIIKALGFTPSEVALVFVGQMALPAVAGALLGVPVGVSASLPLLGAAAGTLGLPVPGVVDPVVDLGIPAGVLILVVIATLVPALRAAGTNSVRAIALGSAPRAARPSRLSGLLRRAHVPRPLSLGAGDAFARPVRALLTLTALGIGVATLTFAFGFQQTMQKTAADRTAIGFGQDVTVQRYPSLGDGRLMALLDAQPETRAVIAIRQVRISLPDGGDPLPVTAMRGDATGFGYHAIDGRWYAAPGEAVVASQTARTSHLRVGDRINGFVEGRPLALRVVGINSDMSPGFRIGWETLAAGFPEFSPDNYLVKLQPGTDAEAFAGRLRSAEPDSLKATATSLKDVADTLAFLYSIVGALTLVLALIAVAGIFNATLLSTRERVHDIATLKAMGMSPAQIGFMAAASALVLAAAGALLGIPVGIWLVGLILGAMADFVGTAFDTNGSFGLVTAALVIASAMLVALLGAALPARWAAATPVAQVLRSE